jgi:hypothetical protein
MNKLMLCCVALMGAVALAHEGGPGEGEPYVPPPVEPIPPGPPVTWVAPHFAHEVWLVDQSNTNGLNYGGTIHIYDGEDLRRNAATAASRVAIASRENARSR